MKNLGYILLIMLFACSQAIAQPKAQGKGRIQAIRAEFVKDRLNLNASQSEKFWPIYNRYGAERKALRKEFMAKHPNRDNMSKQEAHRFVDDNLDYQEEELKLKRKYKDELLKVISARQLADLYQAERDFKKMLIKQLREKKDAPQRR